MRRTIERLAWLIQDAPPETTIGQLAQLFGETPERITDALDVLKIVGGQPTQIPAVDWNDQPLTIQTTIDRGMWPDGTRFGVLPSDGTPDRRLYENRPPEPQQCWCDRPIHKTRCTNPANGGGGLCAACLHGCAP